MKKIFNIEIPKSGKNYWHGLQGAARSIAIASAIESHNGPTLIITPDGITASKIHDEIKFFAPNQGLQIFPDSETLPYDHFSPHQDLISRRLGVLATLPTNQNMATLIPASTLIHRLPPKSFIAGQSFLIKVKDIINIDRFREQMISAGYRCCPQVLEHGEFAIRGAIIDLFPMGSEYPYRIDLFDDEVDSIRRFEPETQRSIDKLTKIDLLPAKEFAVDDESIARFRQGWREHFSGNPRNCSSYVDMCEGICPPGIENYLPLFFEEDAASFIEYLPENCLVIHWGDFENKTNEYWDEINDRFDQRRHDVTHPLLPPKELFLSVSELGEALNKLPRIIIHRSGSRITTLKNSNNEQHIDSDHRVRDDNSSETIENNNSKQHIDSDQQVRNDSNSKTLDDSSKGHVKFETLTPPDITAEHKAPQPLQKLLDFINAHQLNVLFCAESTGRYERLLDFLTKNHINPTPYLDWDNFVSNIENHKPLIIDKTLEKESFDNSKDFKNTLKKHIKKTHAHLHNNKILHQEFTKHNNLGICISRIDQPVYIPEKKLLVVTETQLFGHIVMQRRRRGKTSDQSEMAIRNLAELSIGDPIVHLTHGVGRYQGLQTLDINDQKSDFITVEYAGSNKLYVPVSDLHLISSYTGAHSDMAPLHSLGSDHWGKAKEKAQKRIHDVAAELLDVYAKRASKVGNKFDLHEQDYRQFASEFPFEETADQQVAIEHVLSDMSQEKPMDRLVCGDVGFGKTEVAMRAAFIAIMNNKQVAILVPTTLLAQQHYETLTDRFAGWPVKIAVMSRFNTGKHTENTKKGIKNGTIDIVVGTHKLIQNDIGFKDLGLLIIDEEHRFGVKQKEKIRSLRAEVDILALTATPIPRTLNMAFANIRDLSIIATPPAKRLSIKTFVNKFEKSLLREAIMREVMRGGQVYFLHNDVSTIENMAEELMNLVPEAKFDIAHGQMRERQLEKVMSDFYHRRFNVLICSTIIETGIDIPSANTILINRADKFGLAQLHQLRGRVGRSHHQAYAYLITGPQLTSDAKKRLEAITSMEDLGAGFTLATHDMEIRGAGELLGKEQSGNMQEIGFSLFTALLERAVKALQKGEKITSSSAEDIMNVNSVEINLQITALIPDDYMADINLRLQSYKKISGAQNESEINDIRSELIDRFGNLPEELINLFSVTDIKLRAQELGIKQLEMHNKGGYVVFDKNPKIDHGKIIKMIQNHPREYQMDGPNKLRFIIDATDKTKRIEIADEFLAVLEK